MSGIRCRWCGTAPGVAPVVEARGFWQGAADRYRKRFPGTCEAMDAVRARLVTNTWDPDFHRLEKRVRGLMDDVLAAAQRTAAPEGEPPKTILQAIRGQRCDNGHACACEFDFGPDDANVGLQLSAGCCVHGEKECAPTSAVPGLREWLELEARIARETAPRCTSKAALQMTGRAEAYEAVLREIDRRSPGEANP